MKISLNIKLVSGPYGGGMHFARYLKDFLQNKGEKVVDNLVDDDINIILHISPFPYLSTNAAYSFFDAYLYKLKHPQTKIILRVNECDERKKTNYINRELIKASQYSDYVVFIANWLRPLLINQGLDKNKPYKIILNGADQNIFNFKNKKFWEGKGKLKIVTHHWSNNYLKGHDIYQKLDKLLGKSELAEKFEFTYIGNYPKNLTYNRTNLISPLTGKELAEELKKHHIYITASHNEPAGMHHIEGALCGLPLLYINSGALPEYCRGYGLEFNKYNLIEKLNKMHNDYIRWIEKIKTYPYTAEKMAKEFYELFLQLEKNTKKFTSPNNKNPLTIKLFKAENSLVWKIKKKIKKIKKIIGAKIKVIKNKNITFKKILHYPFAKYYFWATYRRKALDKLQSKYSYLYHGIVLDIGGRDRGKFKKPKDKVLKWIFADIENKHHPDIILDVANMSKLKTASIDVVNAIELFEHVKKIELGLNECYRVLKKNGHLIISVPFLYAIHGDPNDWQRWTKTKWEYELNKINFEIVKLEIMGRYFTVLAEIIRSAITSLPKYIYKPIRWLLFPWLDILVKLDKSKFVIDNKKLSNYHAGYFIIARKK